jgi:signal transduction histidine kinase
VFKNGKELPTSDLPLLKAAATGQSVRDYELELRFDDGKSRYIIGNAVPFLDLEGRSRGSVAIFVDITERKQNEERLRQAQKLESIGLLASGIAHDFNNLLTVIIGNAGIAVNKDPLSKEIQHIIAASDRAAHLTRQLLAYAGKGQFFTRTFNLSDLVFRSMELLSASVSKRVELRFHLSPEELLVKADPSQVEQVFMNLVINAGEAIPSQTDGQIEIATSIQEVTPEIVDEDALAFNAVPGWFACLEVIDNGCGMDEATLARIFDPFFSTKFSGRGLGLAAVQGIVRSCRGFMDVHSSPGAGSTFRVFLPLTHEKFAAEIPAIDRAGFSLRQNHRHAAILVVDDEELVRSMTCTALLSEGYEVLEAKDGKDALRVLTGAVALPSLVLLDLTMPVMGGDELVPILNQDYPRLRIIVTSGYAEAEVRRGFPPGTVAGFLQKPYTVAKLVEKVEEVLNNGGPNEDTPAAA